MPLDISDAESSLLHARAEFEQWHAEFISQWTRPIQLLALGAMVRRMPTELRLAKPKETATVIRLFEEMTGHAANRNG